MAKARNGRSFTMRGSSVYPGNAYPAIDVLDLLASGLAQDQVLEEFPDLKREDIEAVLRYASSKF